ncbi:hypothetical protein NQ318_004599 [Aromia moschata]|uniref:SWI/SNF-related matrix-associated actin-dependent regulator of chromatin subfamily A-like protein 1 n=1 Tax=Aromia moschata TaxID=1265417 RepID=A0AAV8X8D2_9CUCU|nr:hypothetical protein NQ318_004599 [Aromia moschata]
MNRTPQTWRFYGQRVTGKCVLSSNERFSVILNRFSEDALEIFRKVPSKFFDTKTRIWSFHVKDYESLISKFQTIESIVSIEKLPSYVLSCIKKSQIDVDINYDRLDPVLSATLLPFQLDGLRFGIEKDGRCLLADDMGLGKTFQALAIANYYANDWPLLIATTANMKKEEEEANINIDGQITVWEETIRYYLPSTSILQVQYMVSRKDNIRDAKILIVSHDMMKRSLDKLIAKNFGVLPTCYPKKAKRIILLSGTPALSKPSELYTQLSLIDSTFFGSFYAYSVLYCDGKRTHFGWDSTGKSNLQELEIVLAKRFMIRRTKDDVLKALPNKKQEIIKLDTNLQEFSDQDKECLNALALRYNQQKNLAENHAVLLKYFVTTAKMKIPSVCSYVLQVLERKVKFIVFAHHRIMLNAIEDIVKKKGVNYIRIDGSTGSDQRKYSISKFQEDDECLCAILSITSCNAGITLTAASLVLFAELHWNPSILNQAASRAHRIGQQNTVVVQYLIASGTLDDHMWALLDQKQVTLKEMGLSKDSFDNTCLKRQASSENVTEGLNYSSKSGPSGMRSIKSYFTPQKKPKHSETEDVFNDGLDDILNEYTEVMEQKIFG